MFKEDEDLEGERVKRHFRVAMINRNVRLHVRRLKEEQRNGSFVQLDRWRDLWVPEKCHPCSASTFTESVVGSFHPGIFLKMSTQEEPVGGAIGILSLPCPTWVL